LAARSAQGDPPVSAYAAELVEGVVAHAAEIDEIIAEHAAGWTLARLPPVDRNILRVAVFELRWREDIPDRVAIDEAVELAKSVSTERSPGFVNGLLAGVLAVRPSPADGRRDPPAAEEGRTARRRARPRPAHGSPT
jgi:N utilization substance protein B